MKTVFMQGNEACAHGALAAGCRFFGGYPITPSTGIAETLAREMRAGAPPEDSHTESFQLAGEQVTVGVKRTRAA